MSLFFSLSFGLFFSSARPPTAPLFSGWSEPPPGSLPLRPGSLPAPPAAVAHAQCTNRCRPRLRPSIPPPPLPRQPRASARLAARRKRPSQPRSFELSRPDHRATGDGASFGYLLCRHIDESSNSRNEVEKSDLVGSSGTGYQMNPAFLVIYLMDLRTLMKDCDENSHNFLRISLTSFFFLRQKKFKFLDIHQGKQSPSQEPNFSLRSLPKLSARVTESLNK